MMNSGIHDLRAELLTRIGAIEWRGSSTSIALELAAIRRLANGGQMLPAATVSHLLESALVRGERGALVQGWLPMLRDAIGSERQDRAASDAFAAACQVRFAG